MAFFYRSNVATSSDKLESSPKVCYEILLVKKGKGQRSKREYL